MGYQEDFDSTLAAYQTARGIDPFKSGIELVSRERFEGRKQASAAAYRDAPVLSVPRAVALARRPSRRAPVVVRGGGLSGWWDDFKAYNSADAWGSALADAYNWVQYGNTPALVQPAAGETSQQIAERQRAAIAAAERSGDWSATPRLGVTASDVSDAANKLNEYRWWIIGGAVGLGVLALSVARKR